MSLLLALTLAAQAAPPPAEPAPDIVELASDAATRMTVPVSIGEHGPFPFVVDTGAERTVISRELAKRLALRDAGAALLHTVTGTERVDTVMIPQLSVSAVPTTEIRAPALAQTHLGASGMIGVDSLRDRRVVVDFRTNTMSIMPGERHIARSDPDEIIVTARSRLGQLILMGATINGQRVDVVIDTGAQMSVGNALLQRRLMRSRKREKPIDILSVTGARIGATYGVVREMKMDRATITNLPVAFSDAPIFRTLGLNRRPALLLGMDGLRVFDRVSVDFANKRVRFLMPGGADRDDGQTRMAAREQFRAQAL